MNIKRVPRLKIKRLLPALALWGNENPPLPLKRAETDPTHCYSAIRQKVVRLVREQLKREILAKLARPKTYVWDIGAYEAAYNYENNARVHHDVTHSYRHHKKLCCEIAHIVLKYGLGAIRQDDIRNNIPLALMIWELLKIPGLDIAGPYLFGSSEDYNNWRDGSINAS